MPETDVPERKKDSGLLCLPARLQDHNDLAIRHLANHHLKKDDAHAKNVSFGVPPFLLHVVVQAAPWTLPLLVFVW